GRLASRLTGGGGTPPAGVIIRLALAAIVPTVPAVLQLRGRWSLLRRGAGQVAAYGLFAVAGCQLAYFNAIERMPVGVALLLEYLGAVLVVGWLWVRHGQCPRRLTVAGTLAAIAGLAMVLDLGGPARIDPVGVMWGLLAAVGLALYFLLGAAVGDGPLPPIVMAWAGVGVGPPPPAPPGWAGPRPLTPPPPATA